MSEHRAFVRLSATLRLVTLLAMVAIPCLLGLVWWQFDWLAANASELQGLEFDAVKIGPGTKLLGFLISMIPAGAMLYGLWRLQDAFRRFAADEFFSQQTIRCVRAFALMVLLQALLRPIAASMLSVLLTLQNPPGEKALAIRFGSGELEMLFIGGLFFAVAHLMAEGRRIADENARII